MLIATLREPIWRLNIAAIFRWISPHGSKASKTPIRAYCRLVQKNLSGIGSHIVKDAAVLINTRLSEELSTAKIAKMLGVSAGYLSSVFRKEIGKTLSAYIREKRMKNAAHLLKTTHLQVQTVALHSGFLDMQYFSKLFKKETGATPKEYREKHRCLEKQ